MLAPVVALRRMLSEIFASSRVAGREEGRTNRRGQDKSRKVRPVGWGRKHQQILMTPQTLQIPGTSCDFWQTRYCC